MGIFDDKKFEQLDWMTQMTETIESDLNDVLAKLPERVSINAEMVSRWVGGSANNLYLSVGTVLTEFLRPLNTCSKLTYQEESKIAECFEFEMTEGTTLDFSTHTLRGEITLVKIVQTFEDEQLQKDMGQGGINQMNNYCSTDSATLTRANDIMELLGGCESELKNRSARKKMRAIRSRLGDIFANNEWRIRNTSLANKVGIWAAAYIKNGNLAAYTNFCKLKVMTHSNMPIYSIREEPT